VNEQAGAGAMPTEEDAGGAGAGVTNQPLPGWRGDEAPGDAARQAVALQPAELVAHLTALLYAAEEPLPVEQAARVLEVSVAVAAAAAAQLEASPPPGLAVQRHGEALRLVTAPASGRYVERLLGGPGVSRLSRAALEVLAIVAYHQPLTRAEIDALRGVNSERALETLLRRGLVAEVGRRDTVGRPVLLGTTPAFLDYLGLCSLAELPPLEARGEK
jgi:segregation and condensation protein B